MSLSVTTPEVLVLMLSVLALAGLSALTLRWQAAARKRLAAGSGRALLEGAASPRRRAVKVTLLLLALTALVAGAAGPYAGSGPEPLQLQRTDVLVVLDASLSMLAQDVAPSRLHAGRRSVERLLSALQTDRVGLVVFGGTAALRAPLTLDYLSARSVVQAIGPDAAPLPGSSLAEGLRTGLAALRHSDAPRRGILLVSDGEDLGGGVEDAVGDLKTAGIVVSALGVGTVQGATIPVPDEGGGFAIKREASGAVVTTHLEEATLRSIASATGGTYLAASSEGRELVRLYELLRAPHLAGEPPLPERPAVTFTWWLALAALLLLVLEIVIAERPGGRRRRGPAALLMASLVAAVAAGGCADTLAEVYVHNQKGLEAYERGEYASALDAFRHAQVRRPDLPELDFNAGAALYGQADAARALYEWQRAALTDDAGLRQKADFNAGNALFRLDRYEDAAEAYKRVLRADPGDLDAKVNLELALQKLRAGPQPPEQVLRPPGTPQTQPRGDLDPGPQGQQPQPPLNRSQGQQGPDPMPSSLPPQGGQGPTPSESGLLPASQAPPQEPRDPVEALRLAIEAAGPEFSVEEALRILAALRLREPALLERYHNPPDTPGPFQPQRPANDW